MNTKIWLLFFSFLFLSVVLSKNVSAVKYFNNATSKANGTNYNLGITYGFSINCTGNASSTDSGDVNATFTIGRPSGTSTTYYNTTVSAIKVYNESISIYKINITQEKMGTAGTYNYSWTCTNNSDTGETNTTPTIIYVIAKNTTGSGVNVSITVYAHGGSSSVVNNSNANSVQGQGNPYAECEILTSLEGTTNLWRDEVAWTEGSSGATSLSASSYTIKCNTTGNANFTDNSTGSSYTLSILTSGGGGGGGGTLSTTTTTTQSQQTWNPTEGWNIDTKWIWIAVILIVIYAFSKRKK